MHHNNEPKPVHECLDEAGIVATDRHATQAPAWLEADPALQSYSSDTLLQRYSLSRDDSRYTRWEFEVVPINRAEEFANCGHDVDRRP